jgi:putative secretion ATPase (PEP-CTERM system associated)
MYEAFFKLSAAPFRLNPDPKFFFGSRSHNKAMAYLHYGLRQGEGFIVVTGEIGAGKSMLIGHLIDQLDRSNVVAAHLLTSNLEPSALLSHILSAFRIEPANTGESAEIEALEDFLFDQMNRGRRVLLIVDEAQNLPIATIEELRMLSNMNYEGTPLFQVFLVGQPQFRAILAKPEMEQFRQRVIASYHLDPLTEAETKDYIRHRMSVAGWTTDPSIDEGAFGAAFSATGGVPRKINKLFNRVLLHCATEGLHAIDAAVVDAVAKDLGEENLERAAATAIEPPKEESSAEPIKTAAGAENAVVVPFTARKTAPVAAVVAPPQKAEAETRTDAASSPAAVDSSSLSVFDRLRMKRSGATPQQPQAPAPSPATLEDVAEAIAAASAGAAPAPEEAPPDVETDAGQSDTRTSDMWRTQAAKTLSETRDDLKSAHDNVMRLRRQLADFDRRRREKRQHIAANLTRAETLLAEIRNVWR